MLWLPQEKLQAESITFPWPAALVANIQNSFSKMTIAMDIGQVITGTARHIRNGKYCSNPSPVDASRMESCVSHGRSLDQVWLTGSLLTILRVLI